MGPGPIAPHLDHCGGFAEIIGESGGLHLDLGSGGGLPGLALALAWPTNRWFLLDSNRRSADFLSAAVVELGLQERVTVLQGRAEELGREPEYRGQVDVVTARAFGPPATTAECGAPFLAVEGRLVVSDPPDSHGERWPAEGLSQLGQRLVQARRATSGHNFVVIEQMEDAPARFPRRTGVPNLRPLF